VEAGVCASPGGKPLLAPPGSPGENKCCRHTRSLSLSYFTGQVFLQQIHEARICAAARANRGDGITERFQLLVGGL